MARWLPLVFTLPWRAWPLLLLRCMSRRASRNVRTTLGTLLPPGILPHLAALGLTVGGLLALAFMKPVSAQDPADAGPGAMVRLNFPQEVPIQTLVEYVSQRLNINILFDREIGEKRIILRAPNEIPAQSLLGVLESALKISGLALVDAEVPGWKKIVKAELLANVAPAGDASEAVRQYGDMTAVTQAFVLKHAQVEEVATFVEPFLTQPGSNAVTVPQSNVLIVTDYATNIMKIAKWIEFIDKPRTEVTIQFAPVQHQTADQLSAHLTSILTAKARTAGAVDTTPAVEIVPDQHANQLLLIGPEPLVREVRDLIAELDKPLQVVTKAYQFTNVRASKIDEMIHALLPPGVRERSYRSVVDDSENLLVVTAFESVHEQIDQLRSARDIPVKVPENRIGFYKIKNLPVQELLETLRSIESNTFTELRRPGGWRELPTDGRIRPARSHSVPGPNRMPPPAGETDLPPPPALTLPPAETAGVSNAEGSPAGSVAALEASAGPLANTQLLGQARITGDIHSNTLIVVAEPAVQRLYEELIQKLDQPRPQVMVEAKFVILDTSNDFSLGVEVSAGDRTGLKRALAFTSYGLSTVEPTSAALALVPGNAFNGTLVDPETADVVTRALVSNRRARVTSAPRVLVSDNATGQLTSVEEVPFTSVNASQTVATTSFAGFADAGTTITVTPRIRDETSLQLEIAISVNTFTGAGSEGIPPPRQTEEVTSQVIVPDGHTIILGGLNRRSNSSSYTGLPLLNRVPVVRELTGLTSKSGAQSSMFIFIRPVILQEDKFKDLRYISEQDAQAACLCADSPPSRPVWMR